MSACACTHTDTHRHTHTDTDTHTHTHTHTPLWKSESVTCKVFSEVAPSSRNITHAMNEVALMSLARLITHMRPLDFPGGTVVKTLCFWCRGRRFDP